MLLRVSPAASVPVPLPELLPRLTVTPIVGSAVVPSEPT
jgi:hypothetical protein